MIKSLNGCTKFKNSGYCVISNKLFGYSIIGFPQKKMQTILTIPKLINWTSKLQAQKRIM